MKSYILLIALVVAVAEVKATIIGKLIETHEQCRSDANLSDEDIKDLFSLKVQESVKCYLKCFLEKEGFWINGSFDGEKARDLISQFKPLQKYESEINDVLEKCKDVQGEGECEKAFATSKCLVINGLKVLGGIIATALF